MSVNPAVDNKPFDYSPKTHIRIYPGVEGKMLTDSDIGKLYVRTDGVTIDSLGNKDYSYVPQSNSSDDVNSETIKFMGIQGDKFKYTRPQCPHFPEAVGYISADKFNDGKWVAVENFLLNTNIFD